MLLFDTSSGFGLCFPTPIYVISWSRNNWYRQKLKFTFYKDFLCWTFMLFFMLMLFVVTNRCFCGSEAVKSGLLLQSYWNLSYSDRIANHDALGKNEFIERVHTGCHMAPEWNLFEISHFWMSLSGFSFQNETPILDDLLYLYNVNVVGLLYLYESSLRAKEA